MKYNPKYHHRQSIRLREYDYSQSGAYFVTICTHQKQCLFGEIREGKMVLNQIGKIAAQEWLKSSEIRQEIALDQWVIMPNHLHGIVWIKNADKLVRTNNEPMRAQSLSWWTFPCVLRRRGLPPLAPLPKQIHRKPKSLSTFISGFKSAVTIQINHIRQTSKKPVWQRNYYESIIRDQQGLNTVRNYIITNPQKWGDDRENPHNNHQEVTLSLDFPF